MPDNRKYRPSLYHKVQLDKKEAAEQEKLRTKYDVPEDVKIKEEGILHGALGVLLWILRIALAALAFVFLVVLLYPETRELFLKEFLKDRPVSLAAVLAVPVIYLIVTIAGMIRAAGKRSKGKEKGHD